MASFREQVDSLIGKRVRLGRGGPDERKGTLVSVQDEFLSVYSDDGSMVHYPLHHLKSVTELMGGEEGSGDGSGGGSGGGSGWDQTGGGTGFPSTFRGLMDSFLGQKVQVYDHGPESAAGFVFGVGDDYVQLVTGPDEMVHYPFFHIRSVRLAKPKNENKNGGKSGNKGGGGKSGGGKSGGGKSGSGNRGGSDDGKSGRGNRGGSSSGKSGRGRRGGSGGGKSGGGRSGRGNRGKSGGGRKKSSRS